MTPRSQQTTVTLPFPVPLAACFIKSKGGSGIPSARYKAYKAEAAALIASQKPLKISGPVVVDISLCAPDARARDADNLMKCLFDCLVNEGLLTDDSCKVVKAFSVVWDDTGPACRVRITSVGAEWGAA